MNIETLSDLAKEFEVEVIESGFKRDLQDYISSYGNNQNNVVALRNIANSIFDYLQKIYIGDLPDALDKLLQNKKPFTGIDYHQKLKSLLENKEIPLQDFYTQLSQILTPLNQNLQENITEINRIKDFIQPYINSEQELITQEEKAIVSIIFKEERTITNLKEFTKNLHVWNRTLPLYHQLLKSSSPEDIEILEVQNGSIDLVINLNVDIAFSLTELFNIGFKCYGAYLAYKKLAQPIIQSYFGNPKLIKGEHEREKELLNNISISVAKKIEEQHKLALKSNKSIDKNIEKKVEQVTNLVTTHIVKGNDIKLLAYPINDDKDEKDDMRLKSKQELIDNSREVRKELKAIPEEDLKLLLEKYGELKSEDPLD